MKKSMVVSLIGRPNVGKSSLFNILMERPFQSITYDTPGVTRDRHYGVLKLDEIDKEEPSDIILVDTGGFYPEEMEADQKTLAKNPIKTHANYFFNIMREHAFMAIDESDIVLQVVDAREGILPFDQSIADYIRSQNKEFWVIINKFDSDLQSGDEIEFYNLGINQDEMFMTSAAHNRGISDLRRKLQLKLLAQQTRSSAQLNGGVTPKEDVIAKVAIIGGPNAGKSTLLNHLVGATRALVSDVAGTTVDPIEGYFDLYFGRNVGVLKKQVKRQKDFSDKGFSNGKSFLQDQYELFRSNNPDFFNETFNGPVHDDEEFISPNFDDSENPSEVEKKENGSYWRSLHIVDTAGIRKKSNIEHTIEGQSVFRSLRCITESDIVILMADATKGVGHQDRRLIDIALEKGKSVIICLNKFDLIRKTHKTEADQKQWYLDIRDKLPWVDYCDILPISALKGQGIKSLKNSLKKTIAVRSVSIPTGRLNRFVTEIIDKKPVIPSGGRGKMLKVKYTSMLKSSPPTFIFFSNKSKGIPETYKRYIKNSLRREFDLFNSPIHLIFRSSFDLEKRAMNNML